MTNGFTQDHAGKRSASRVTSLLASATLCAIGIGQVFGGFESPDATLLWTLGALALGPIGLNRGFGEKQNGT